VNPTNRVQAGIETKEAQAAAKIFEVHLVTVAASTPGDIEAAFATLLAEHVGALLVSGEYFFTTQRNRLIALASEHRLPTVYGNREITASGGLMS
jgi:putative ABC transport system substrate-binding protein